jgi:hypothetical protein
VKASQEFRAFSALNSRFWISRPWSYAKARSAPEKQPSESTIRIARDGHHTALQKTLLYFPDPADVVAMIFSATKED